MGHTKKLSPNNYYYQSIRTIVPDQIKFIQPVCTIYTTVQKSKIFKMFLIKV